MDASKLQETLKELAGDYYLDRSEIVDIACKTLEQVLTTRYPDQQISVFVSHDFSEININGYGGAFDTHTRNINVSSLSGIKNLHRHIKTALDLTLAYKQMEIMKKRKHTIVKGRVVSGRMDGTIYVEMEIEAPYDVPLIGTTRRELIPKKEFSNFRPGYTTYFHVRDCVFSTIGDILRIDVQLDRISKTLTREVLKKCLAANYPELASHARITVRYRKAGEVTEIWADHQIPGQLKKDIEKYFPGEKILIFVGKNKQEINRRKGKNHRRKKHFQQT